MVDIAKQIAYWRDGAEEELGVARILLEKGKWAHGLFFAHLAVEKLLKAFVCRETRDLAPRIHNLVRLAELAQVALSAEQLELLAKMNEFYHEGRYPNPLIPPPSPEATGEVIRRTEELLQWLRQRL